MKCPFCQEETEGSGSGIYQCNKCPIPTSFICSGNLSSPDIIYIQFVFDEFLIELDMDDRKCHLFLLGHPHCNLIFSISHVPNITPTNAQDWLKKFFHLKAFF